MSNDLSAPPAPQERTEADLVALVGSRLCHDLISPLGAIGNGVELISMTAQADGPELQMISESVAAATAHLRFFRIAFGHAAAGQRIAEAEVSSILREMSGAGRIRYHWQIGGDQPRQKVKLALLALMCIESALPRGGDICIHADDNGWTVSGRGSVLRADAALWRSLGGRDLMVAETTLTPAQVQYALLPREAGCAGCSLRWSIGETTAEISF